MGRFLAFFKNQTTDSVQTADRWARQSGRDIAEGTGHFSKKLYVIDVKAAMLYPVNKEFMLKILLDFPELNAAFKTENDPIYYSTFASYLQKINELK